MALRIVGHPRDLKARLHHNHHQPRFTLFDTKNVLVVDNQPEEIYQFIDAYTIIGDYNIISYPPSSP